MASRVNTRFVAFLAVGLMLLGGGVMVAAYFALAKSGPEYIAIGDSHAAEGNWEKAYEFYGKGVSKGRTNAEWIDKWIGAMEKTTPTPQQKYIDRYKTEYLPALKAYADALPKDVKAQRRYLDEWFNQLRRGQVSPDAWDPLVDAATDAITRIGEGDSRTDELRRYRGFANVAKLTSAPENQRAEFARQAEQDLAAASAANPEDSMVAVEHANLVMIRAEEARRKGDTATADALEGETVAMLRRHLQANPGSPTALWALLRVELVQGGRRTPAPTQAQLYAEKHERFVEMFEAFRKQPAGKLDMDVLYIACDMASKSEEIGNAGVVKLLQELEEKHGGTVLAMMVGEYQLKAKKFEQCVAAYQKVIDAPDVPLSYEGFLLLSRRAEAYRQQVIARLTERDAIQRELASEDPALMSGKSAKDADAALAKARATRDKLAEYVGKEAPLLKLLDAQIAFAAAQYGEARRLVDDYNRGLMAQDPNALLLQARVTEMLGDVGTARTAYEKIVDRFPNSVETLKSLAALELSQQNYAASVKWLSQAQAVAPTDAVVDQMLSRARQLQRGEEQGGEAVTDSIVRAAMEAQKASSGLDADLKRAADILKNELEFQLKPTPGMPRTSKEEPTALYVMLVQVLLLDDRREEALTRVNEGLARAPGDARLIELKEILEIADPLEAALLSIDKDAKLTDFKRHLARFMQLTRAKEFERAQAELDAMEKLEPEADALLEAKFRLAVLTEDMQKAQDLARLAAERNLDRVGGLVYQAQLKLIAAREADLAGRGSEAMARRTECAALLDQATEKDRTNANVWQQLGLVRLDLGRYAEAATAFGSALAIRPQEVISIVGYLKSLGAQNKIEEALLFARDNQRYGENNMDFVELWLRLEALGSKGDLRPVIEMRRKLAQRFSARPPADPDLAKRNNAELVQLLIRAGSMGEARTMLDGLRAAGDDPRYVEQDIRWHMARNDARQAVEIFNAYVTSLPPEEHNERPYIVLSGIFQEQQRFGLAIQALRDGRTHESPDSILCDTMIGDLHFGLREWDKAVESYEAALARSRTIKPADAEKAKQQADARTGIDGKVVEALIRMERFDEAEARIASMGAAAESSAGIQLLRAQIMAGQGKLLEAERAFDAAIAADKENPVGYIMRAEFLARDEKHLRDAQQDLVQALKFNPRHLGARQQLANLHLRNNQPEDAVRVLRDGIAADPDNDQLRMDLIGLHLRLKQDREAINVVNEALVRRPEDPVWLFRGREVMYALKRFNDAEGYASRLWERRRDVEAALAYVDAALRMDSPNYTKVMDILATPSLEIDKNLRLRLVRARAQLKRNRAADAMVDLRAAMAMVNSEDVNQVQLFMSGMTSVYPDPKERLQAMMTMRPAEGFRSWMAFYVANLKTSIPEAAAEGMSEMRAIAESEAVVNLRKRAYGVLGGRMRQAGDSRGAVEVWREGLRLDEADGELNNNVAYCLSEDLQNPQEALPYAERAVRAIGADAAILDTLGVVYSRLKQWDKAEETLRRALALSADQTETAPVLIHLAEVRFEVGDKDGACAMLRRARGFLEQFPDLQAVYGEKARALEQKFGCQ